MKKKKLRAILILGAILFFVFYVSPDNIPNETYSKLCYQETANAPNINDGDCGLNYNGNYFVQQFNAESSDSKYLNDGNWNTYSVDYYLVTPDSIYKANYFAPEHLDGDSIMKLRYRINFFGPESDVNITISKYMLENNQLKIKMQHVIHKLYGGYYNFTVYFENSSGSYVLYNIGPTQDAVFSIYEEGIYWNVTN